MGLAGAEDDPVRCEEGVSGCSEAPHGRDCQLGSVLKEREDTARAIREYGAVTSKDR